MPERESQSISERGIREAELQMTGRPPASATGFIGFRPVAPANQAAGAPPPGTANGAGPTDDD